MRYRLRTLLIVLAVMPPLVWIGWTKYTAWRAAQEQLRAQRARWEWLDRFGTSPPPSVLRDVMQRDLVGNASAEVPMVPTGQNPVASGK